MPAPSFTDGRQDVIAEVLDDIDELSGLLGELVDVASGLAAAKPDVCTELGSGLGLGLVQEEIVRSHNGTVFAGNGDGGGAEVGFTIPAV